MPQLPMVPGWEGWHPILIHFPIVLFLLAPVFLLLAGFTKTEKRSTFLVSALLVMVLGITSVYAAFEAGQAGAVLLDQTGQVMTVVEHHRKLADLARTSLAIATLLFGLTLLMRTALELNLRELSAVLPVGFIAFYGLGLFWLIHAAYNGERLVHEFGVGRVVSP